MAWNLLLIITGFIFLNLLFRQRLILELILKIIGSCEIILAQCLLSALFILLLSLSLATKADCLTLFRLRTYHKRAHFALT